MKTNNIIIKSFFICMMLLYACSQPQTTPQPETQNTKPTSADATVGKPQTHQPAEVHLGLRMAGVHHFFTKAGYSIQAGNYVLAQFYVTEMTEEADDIIQLNVVEDTTNISELMKTLLLPSLEKLKKDLAGSSVSDMKQSYQNLISNCNGCHTAANHPYIIVQEPTGNPPAGQQFAPLQLPQ